MNLQVKIGNDKIDLPWEFNHIQWMRLKAQNQEMNPLNLLHVCTGIDKSQLKKAELSQVEDIANILTNLYFSATPSNEVVLTFFHNGIEYGLQKDFAKLKYGAWVDLEVYSSDEIDKNIPKILSLLYYPILKWEKKKYILEEYSDELVERTAEEFKDVPMRIWHGAANFFFLFAGAYIGNIQSSLNTTMRMEGWYQKGKKMLPKFLQKRLPHDFIFGVSKS